MIELSHVSKEFGAGANQVHAVRDVSLSIDKGDIFGVIGFSGAGKSTLVRCINYLERPTSGEVVVDGVALGSLSRRQLLVKRREMSMIFQGFNLLEQRTALRNVCYPLEIAGVNRAAAKEKALELLSLVGLSDKAGAYPAQLSGGQQQRVAIARALASDPRVLLCDEATSALDPNTTRSILELLQSINRTLGVTIIVITHEMQPGGGHGFKPGRRNRPRTGCVPLTEIQHGQGPDPPQKRHGGKYERQARASPDLRRPVRF